MSFAGLMFLAMALDAAMGWPDRLYRRIGHPVVWIGTLISALEARLNAGAPGRRRATGALTVALVCAAVAMPASLVQAALPGGWPGLLVGALAAWPFLAVRSMDQHVAAVARPLVAGDLAGARRAVAMIVGRDPARLDTRGVARAALESLAENTSDGIVAPLFWGVVAGLPGLAVYKAINTMDSMIGHRSERYEDFGKAAARLDDLVNLLPARLTGLLFALASGRPGRAVATMRRDARQHRSPNAGWPEAAMAGALHLRLSGPRIYGDTIADEPYVNAGAPDPEPEDMRRGLALYRRTMVLSAGLLLLVWVL
ncbi:adenosylcobinamide-phosphate synthase CbiB [Ponticoccus alexandrii]|uniref:Cobalamin biosynthesis protein CobD n=1 Tax=Ponticoccus alexandrii TaxID=1943633 RepID=A0ABX7F529_9RHOB|nr:adenosylcobinamide-phosphate synthase CbiB [Ponticoccus alexandrii]ETA53510.1 cobalamin biosynthesis protein CobD [Rhodobacteraceae bacterium PD-2]QRF65219.1 cobalamin biosynthesis protein CobD [Ponticoccus alexandrii]